MRIKFIKRISGCDQIAYKTVEKEVESYQVLHSGDEYTSPVDNEIHTCYGIALLVNGNSVYVLKPGSSVTRI